VGSWYFNSVTSKVKKSSLLRDEDDVEVVVLAVVVLELEPEPEIRFSYPVVAIIDPF